MQTNELNRIAQQLGNINGRLTGIEGWVSKIDEKISNGLSEELAKHSVEIASLKVTREDTSKAYKGVMLRFLTFFFAVLLAVLSGRLIPS